MNKCELKRRATRKVTIGICIFVGCGSKSDSEKGIGIFCLSSIIYNQGKETEELLRLRREKQISAISIIFDIILTWHLCTCLALT